MERRIQKSHQRLDIKPSIFPATTASPECESLGSLAGISVIPWASISAGSKEPRRITPIWASLIFEFELTSGRESRVSHALEIISRKFTPLRDHSREREKRKEPADERKGGGEGQEREARFFLSLSLLPFFRKANTASWDSSNNSISPEDLAALSP